MIYEIYKDGELLNTIYGSESFVVGYCERNGYTYKDITPEPEPLPEPEPTIGERVSDLETTQAQQAELINIIITGDTGEETA